MGEKAEDLLLTCLESCPDPRIEKARGLRLWWEVVLLLWNVCRLVGWVMKLLQWYGMPDLLRWCCRSRCLDCGDFLV